MSFSDVVETVTSEQWRTQKNFMEGVSFSDIWWSFLCGVRSL